MDKYMYMGGHAYRIRRGFDIFAQTGEKKTLHGGQRIGRALSTKSSNETFRRQLPLPSNSEVLVNTMWSLAEVFVKHSQK